MELCSILTCTTRSPHTRHNLKLRTIIFSITLRLPSKQKQLLQFLDEGFMEFRMYVVLLCRKSQNNFSLQKSLKYYLIYNMHTTQIKTWLWNKSNIILLISHIFLHLKTQMMNHYVKWISPITRMKDDRKILNFEKLYCSFINILCVYFVLIVLKAMQFLCFHILNLKLRCENSHFLAAIIISALRADVSIFIVLLKNEHG